MNPGGEKYLNLNPIILFLHKNPLPGLLVNRAQNYQIVDANQQALSLYEYSKSEMITKRLQEISINGDEFIRINHLNQDSPSIPPFKTRHLTQSKKMVDVEVYLTIWDDFVLLQVKPDPMDGYKQLYQNLLNSMITGYARHQIIQDENGIPIDYRFLEINPAFERNTGKTTAQILGKTALEIWPELDPLWVKKYGEVTLTGKTIDFEQYANNLDKYFHVHAYSLTPGEFITIFIDITEYKKNQDKLQQYTREREQDLSILYQVAYLTNHQVDLVHKIQNLLETISQSTKAIASFLIFHEQHPILETSWISYPQQFPKSDGDTPFFQPALSSIMNLNKQKIISGKDIPDIYFAADDQVLVTPLVLSKINFGVLVFVFQKDIEITAGHTTLVLAIADQLSLVFENLNLRNLIKKTAVLEERQRISRELHDSVTQSLYSLNLISQAGLDRLEEQALDEVQACLLEIRSNTLQALREMRLLLYELHPPILEEIGLIEAVQNRLNSVERKTDIQVNFEFEDHTPLDSTLQSELYRIIVEALNNILKHAQANQINLCIIINHDHVKINLSDNGIGFNLTSAKNLGYGLTAMKERAEKINALFEIQSSGNQGTTISILYPGKKEEA